MGRGRNGVVFQSKKALKRILQGANYYVGKTPGTVTSEPINYITPNEMKIAEQMTPQELVNLLLGWNTSAGRDDIAN